MARRTGLALVWLAAGAGPAIAEVADKVATWQSSSIWLAALAVLAIALGRIRNWLPLMLVPPAWLLALSTVAELTDPHVGPAIRDELGDGHVIAQYGFALLFAILPIAAWLLALRTAVSRQSGVRN
jgi:hypothetical protein